MLLLNRVLIARRSVNDWRRKYRLKRSVYRVTEESKLKQHRMDQERKSDGFSTRKEPGISLVGLKNIKVPTISGLIKSFFRTSF